MAPRWFTSDDMSGLEAPEERYEEQDNTQNEDFNDESNDSVIHPPSLPPPALKRIPSLSLDNRVNTMMNEPTSTVAVAAYWPLQGHYVYARYPDQNEEKEEEDNSDEEESITSTTSSSAVALKSFGGITDRSKSEEKGLTLQATDVICGRSSQSHSHAGNQHYQKLIHVFREAYRSTDRREEKTRITSHIIALIQQTGRFLLKDGETDEWMEADTKTIHEKVSHALRSVRDPHKPKFRKKRSKPVVGPPSPEEEAEFSELLHLQSAVYDQLLETNQIAPDSDPSDEADQGDYEEDYQKDDSGDPSSQPYHMRL